MSKNDLITIMDACKPTPAIMLHISPPADPQERANAAWKALGERMGFDYMTVQPVEGEPATIFTAVPSETSFQREAREAAEAVAAKENEVKALREEIANLQAKLSAIEGETTANQRNEAYLQQQQ